MIADLDRRILILNDLSNIHLSAGVAADMQGEGALRARLRIQAGAIKRLAAAGRPNTMTRTVTSANDFARLERVVEHFDDAGFGVTLLERGRRTGKELGADHYLQLCMLREVFDAVPGVIVLLSGDGAGHEEGIGFLADLKRARSRGWGIEVLAWDRTCSRELKAWVQRQGPHGVYIPLDRYYYSITFVEGGRRALPLSLRGRPQAVPGDSNGMAA
ncbi:hypothetical protein [Microbispora amethystogenes]|uniref:NYN domain-containing protein n=1 Tax=Microbispora amethystogenes TaxID=1427754 RepID=A0ABQ4FN81_9ACTN|nr:hypothetical protein [Microbispora amethystogenes]GIH36275.1 hypothetical protein Mam01_64390 [Microbispora amethystogenes]